MRIRRPSMLSRVLSWLAITTLATAVFAQHSAGPDSAGALKVIGIRIIEPLTGRPSELIRIDESNATRFAAVKEGDAWGWPDVHDDLGSERIEIAWQMTAPSLRPWQGPADIQLEINGRALAADAFEVQPGAWNCPVGELCFSTTILRTGWPVPRGDAPNVKSVKLMFGKDDQQAEALVSVAPTAHPVSYFKHYLGPTFKHDRCAVCHSFDTAETIVNAHQDFNVEPAFEEWNVSELDSELQAGESVNGCGFSCHEGPDDNFPQLSEMPGLPWDLDLHSIDWLTPDAGQGLDWGLASMSESEICNKITSNLSVDELDDHFRRDARLVWAVHSGKRAPDMGPDPVAWQNIGYLDPAPPESYEAWIDLIEPWIAAGAPCGPVPPLPDDLFFRQTTH